MKFTVVTALIAAAIKMIFGLSPMGCFFAWVACLVVYWFEVYISDYIEDYRDHYLGGKN